MPSLLIRCAAAVARGLGRTAVLFTRGTVRIPAPHPIGVRRTALGVEVDVHSLAAALITELAADAPDDDAELAAIRDESGPARDRLLEELINRLGGATIRLAATDARRLADTLLALAGPTLQQRNAS